MKLAIEETKRRRNIQEKYNLDHGITPKTIIKEIVGENKTAKDINIEEERFITYSYACVGQEYWQDEKTLKLLEKEFYKFEWDIKTKEEKQQFISKYIE